MPLPKKFDEARHTAEPTKTNVLKNQLLEAYMPSQKQINETEEIIPEEYCNKEPGTGARYEVLKIGENVVFQKSQNPKYPRCQV